MLTYTFVISVASCAAHLAASPSHRAGLLPAAKAGAAVLEPLHILTCAQASRALA